MTTCATGPRRPRTGPQDPPWCSTEWRPTTSRSRHSPGRHIGPAAEDLPRPIGRFVRVATRTRIRNLQLVGHRRRDEPERVTADVHVGDRLLDPRHVAGNALAAGAAPGVMGVVLERRRVRTIRRGWSMAGETEIAGWLDEQRVIRRAVR